MKSKNSKTTRKHLKSSNKPLELRMQIKSSKNSKHREWPQNPLNSCGSATRESFKI